MRTRMMILLCVLLIAACGHGAGPITVPEGPQRDAAPAAVAIAGKLVTVTSSPYLNLMPPVTEGCNPVIVPAYFSVDNEAFPQGVEVESVALFADDRRVWAGPIAREETRMETGRLFAIARGCMSRDVALGTMLEGVFEISHQGGRYLVRAPAVALTAAY